MAIQPATHNWSRRAILAGVLLNITLVVVGLALFPSALSASSEGLAGAAAAVGILLVYALLPGQLERRGPEAVRYGTPFGLTAGLVFAGEIILEYVALPDVATNARMGLIEFGTVFALFFAAAVVAGYRTGQIRGGVLAALWSALVASLVWLAALLLMYYAFHGTARQTAVLSSEGTFDDFARSGMQELDAFVMQDLLGAAFFHLLLAPIIALILGAAGGAAGRLPALWRKHCGADLQRT